MLTARLIARQTKQSHFLPALNIYIHLERIFMFSLTLKQKRKNQNYNNIWTHKKEANEKFRILDMYNQDFSGYTPPERIKIGVKYYCLKHMAAKGVRTRLYIRGGPKKFPEMLKNILNIRTSLKL
jgi:hypothetical protein